MNKYPNLNLELNLDKIESFESIKSYEVNDESHCKNNNTDLELGHTKLEYELKMMQHEKAECTRVVKEESNKKDNQKVNKSEQGEKVNKKSWVFSLFWQSFPKNQICKSKSLKIIIISKLSIDFKW